MLTSWKLHDVVTRELAIRIGGNKTGLLNGSMVRLIAVSAELSDAIQ